MKNICLKVIYLGLCIGLGACSTATKEKLGLKKTAPNEFMVSTRAPLSLPPEYDLLPVNQEIYNNHPALVDTEGMSSGEQALLNHVSSAGKK